MKQAISLFAVLLTGCAAQVLSSNPRSVVVMAGSEMIAGAQATADAECRKYNRYAKFTRKVSTMQFAFDCVE